MVKSAKGNLRKCQVVESKHNGDEVLVHYAGFNSKFDEWIPTASGRFGDDASPEHSDVSSSEYSEDSESGSESESGSGSGSEDSGDDGGSGSDDGSEASAEQVREKPRKRKPKKKGFLGAVLY